MRILIIDNNCAQSRDDAVYDFIRVFAAHGDEITLRYIDDFTNTDAIFIDAESFDCVIPYGDDNTVTACCYALKYRKVPILPFPANEGNLLHLNLDLPMEPHSLVSILRRSDTLDYDMGEIEFFDYNGKKHQEGFAIMAGAGYDASIMEYANKLRKNLGPFAFLFSAFSQPNPQKAQIKLNIDGEEILTEGVAVLLINFAKLAPDLSVTHINDAQDGLLEIVVLNSENLMELFPALLAMFMDRTGKHPDRSSKLEIYVGSEIEIETVPPLSIQYDGITVEAETPLKAHTLPESLRLIV